MRFWYWEASTTRGFASTPSRRRLSTKGFTTRSMLGWEIMISKARGSPVSALTRLPSSITQPASLSMRLATRRFWRKPPDSAVEGGA